MSRDFRAFVEELIERPEFGSKDRLAKRIGLTGSAFWRHVADKGTLGLVSLLRLAIAAGESPQRVLELAGKAEEAEWIVRAFGPEREVFADIDRRILALSRTQKDLVLNLVATESPPGTWVKRGPPGRRSARTPRASSG